MTDDLILKIVN